MMHSYSYTVYAMRNALECLIIYANKIFLKLF